MVKTTIGIIALCWLAYNGWRVFSAPRNAVEVGADVQANCPPKFAFQTYMKVREFYLLLSPGHKKYEMSGASFMKDVVIDVWETAGFQFVKHQYRVTELVLNERMGLVSEKSQVKVLGLFKAESRSEVEFRFYPTADAQTNLGLTIRIVSPNWFRHLLARLFFTEAIWRAHARAEMNALAKIIEQRYAIETAQPLIRPRP
jgi:hypothetical protein